jgi:hypothetical protein
MKVFKRKKVHKSIKSNYFKSTLYFFTNLEEENILEEIKNKSIYETV